MAAAAQVLPSDVIASRTNAVLEELCGLRSYSDDAISHTRRTNGKLSVHGFKNIKTSLLTPICERHAYSFTVDYISSGDADSITLHLSDAVEVWADDNKGIREPKGRVPLTLKDASAEGFLESLKVALSADVQDKKRSGTITMATLSPPYITMEECACLRDHYPGVIDVTLTPKGIKVLFADVDNTIKNIQRMKRTHPHKFKPATGSVDWLHKKLPDTHRSPAAKRSGVPRRVKETSLSSKLAHFFGLK